MRTTRDEWLRIVRWQLALGTSEANAIATADRGLRRNKQIEAAEKERFNEYGMRNYEFWGEPE